MATFFPPAADLMGIPGTSGDRGCVACAVVATDDLNRTFFVDDRGRYWCFDCSRTALAHVRRRTDERTGYVYPWTFETTGGLNGQHISTAKPVLTYVRLPQDRATVRCRCGWEDEPMPISPFDPMEAVAAAHAVHNRCNQP